MDRISRGAKAHLLQYLPPDGEHHFDELLRDPDYQIFHHAPVLIVISAVHDGAWTIEDCALAAGNLMLAAVGHGLGSCWVGLAQSWLQLPEGKAALGVDDDCVPVAPIVIGHPRGTTRPVARTPARVHWIG